MPIFVILVIGATIFGAGVILAPVLPTAGPRVGLAGALYFALVTVGSILCSCLFGWNTRVTDFVWLAALVGALVARVFAARLSRSKTAGNTQMGAGWPGMREIVFFVTVAIVFIAPVLIFPVPLDTDAQGFGYLALIMRQSGSLTTLAPYHPEVNYLYSPAQPALIAYLSERFDVGMHTLQFGVGAILCILFVCLAYDFGNEVDPERERGSRRMGITTALCGVIGLGLMTTYLDSHFTTLMGLVFALAFLTFAIRYQRDGSRFDFIGAAVTLACVPLSQPDMTIILALGYVPWLIMVWLSRPRPRYRDFLARWLGLAVGIPLVAVLCIAPWLVQIAPLLGSEIQSPFEISSRHLIVLVVYHGGLVALLALGGVAIGLRRRRPVDVLMIVWLLLIVDFSSLGILKALAGPLLEPILKYDYPFSVAWHGPIIPFMYLSAQALHWMTTRRIWERHEWRLRRASLPLMVLVSLVAVLVVLFAEPLLRFSKTTPMMMFGTFSSHADVAAMNWINQNTSQDSLILNHPAPYEADWVPVIAQRNAVYFRPQPFFQHTTAVEAMQDDLRAFWRTPDDVSNAELLERYGVDYVIVPQVFARPDLLVDMYRWRPPFPLPERYRLPDDSPFLELVFEQDGAQVWQVHASE